MSDANAVLTERLDHTLLVTINRPEARNAVNHDVWVGLGQALELADNDVDIRAVVVTGAGTASFCAGADLKAVARGERILPEDPTMADWGFAGYVKHHISKPTIAAVNGFALGGGTEITLASDLAVAADTATFGLPEVGRGILAAAGGAFRLPAQVPRKVAMEMLLTGEPISAQRGFELGLINAVVPASELIDRALVLAARIAANAPLSVQASKRIALGIIDGDLPGEDEAWARSARERDLLRDTEDAREGPRAFAEKRAPIWRGR